MQYRQDKAERRDQLEEEQVNLDDLPKPKTQQISKEQVKQQFQSEAGALRPKSSSTED